MSHSESRKNVKVDKLAKIDICPDIYVMKSAKLTGSFNLMRHATMPFIK